MPCHKLDKIGLKYQRRQHNKDYYTCIVLEHLTQAFRRACLDNIRQCIRYNVPD